MGKGTERDEVRRRAATADHIRWFGAPLLRLTLLEQADAHRDRFSPIACDAIARLRRDAD